MDALLKRRRTLKGKVTRIHNIIGQHGANPLTILQLNDYSEQVVILRQQLEELHDEVSAVCDDADFGPQEDEYNQLALRIDTLKVSVESFIPATAGSNSNSSSGSGAPRVSSDVKLPRLDLPTFNGELSDWTSFHDLFAASLHQNKLLSGAQKLQYLKASLKGDALSLIQSVQVTDDNYAEAWDILLTRYQNKREIVNTQIKRIFNQQSIQIESPVNLRKLLDTTSECVRALRVLGLETDRWDPLLVYLVTEKLDSESRRQWELSLKGDELASFKELSEFILQRARALAAAGPSKIQTIISNKTVNHNQSNKKSMTAVHHADTKQSCYVCDGEHAIWKCETFKKMTIKDRRQNVQKLGLCFNCFGKGHNANKCERGSCKQCTLKHNTMLHVEGKAEPSKPTEEAPAVQTLHSSDNCGSTLVLLSTALVKVRNIQGREFVCRALLDSGSQASFVTEKFAQILSLKSQRTRIPICGLGQTGVGTSYGLVELQISSLVSQFNINIHALILSKITGPQPRVKCNTSTWSHIHGLKLVDPNFHEHGPIDILLGADIYPEIMLGGRLEGETGSAVAFQSQLGWVLCGRVNTTQIPPSLSVHHAHFDLDVTLRKFWELEELPSTSIFTPEEKSCENHFTLTHTRSPDGRYIVKLPIKKDTPELGQSRDIAIRRFKQVERRLC